jgi:protein-tyrosine phosphatase
MAEAVWNWHMVNAGLPALACSAGLSARLGDSIDPIAGKLLAERAIETDHLKSTPLRSMMLRDFDLVLVMEDWQKSRLEHIAPFARGRIFTLGHWSGIEVPDPYGESEDFFRKSLNLIDQGIGAWLKKLG